MFKQGINSTEESNEFREGGRVVLGPTLSKWKAWAKQHSSCKCVQVNHDFTTETLALQYILQIFWGAILQFSQSLLLLETGKSSCLLGVDRAGRRHPNITA